MGVWKGRMMGNTWISDKEPLLLDFNNTTEKISVCGKQLTISNQSFAVEGLKQRTILYCEYLHFLQFSQWI